MTAQDAAILIGAVTAAVVGLGGFAMQMMTFLASQRRDAKLELVHNLVNSQTDALKKAIGESAFAEGQAAGILTERGDPHANSPKT